MDFKAAVEFAKTRNDELIRRYKDSARFIRVSSVSKVLESIIEQKTKQDEILQETLDSPGASENPPLVITQSLLGPAPRVPEASDPPKSLLAFVRAEETRLAALYACLRDAARDDETHRVFRSLSESALKFSAWVKDHLELLELF